MTCSSSSTDFEGSIIDTDTGKLVWRTSLKREGFVLTCCMQGVYEGVVRRGTQVLVQKSGSLFCGINMSCSH